MTEFRKYQHVENMSNTEVEGILDGICYVFYKIDGTNAQVWLNEEGEICYGSRNRVLSLDNDNAGFMAWASKDLRFDAFLKAHPTKRLYGEWLVPHSLKTYADEAWRKFYVFDVVDSETNEHINYDVYKVWMDEFGLDYIPPLAIFKNPSEEHIIRSLEKSGQFLIEDGKGKGEGVVIKNYDFVNRFGRTAWAKKISNEFKTVHHKAMGAPEVNNSLLIEERIVGEFVTSDFIGKEFEKIKVDVGEWNNKLIPRLLGTVYYELIREHSWDFVKKFKDPKINYKTLRALTTRKVKEFLEI